MKKLYTLIFLIVSFSTLQAQLSSNYTLTNSTNVQLENISIGSNLLLGFNSDDATASPIGFPFKFNGKSFSNVYVNANGQVGLDVAPIEYPFDFYLKEATVYPLIAVWGDDLTTTSNGGVSYKIVGDAPYRKLIIEWRVMKTSDQSAVYNKTFQLWLFETSNKIQFVYGQAYVDDFNGGTIGIAASEEDILNINAGTQKADAADYVNWGVWPGANNSYIFTSTAAVAEPLTVANDGKVKNVSCYGLSDGSIALGTVAGGEGNYSLSWKGDNNFSATGNVIHDVPAGVYTYTLTDGAQTITGSIEVLQPQALTIQASSTNASCVSGRGTITVKTNGTYTITASDGSDVSKQADFAPGVYTIVATSENADQTGTCSSTPVNVTIEAAKTFDASISVSPEYTVMGQLKHTIYLGYKEQSVQLLVNPGTTINDEYSYSWFPMTGLDNATSASPSASPIATTTYTATITNKNGCSIQRAITVNVIDVRSGDKIKMCIKGKEESVKEKDVEKKLKKENAYLGACQKQIVSEEKAAQKYAAPTTLADNKVVATAPVAIKVFPNPTTGKFMVTIPEMDKSDVNIQVVDMTGRTVATKSVSIKSTSQNVAFDLSDKSQGLYFVKVISGHKMQTAKLIIKR